MYKNGKEKKKKEKASLIIHTFIVTRYSENFCLYHSKVVWENFVELQHQHLHLLVILGEFAKNFREDDDREVI